MSSSNGGNCLSPSICRECRNEYLSILRTVSRCSPNTRASYAHALHHICPVDAHVHIDLVHPLPGIPHRGHRSHQHKYRNGDIVCQWRQQRNGSPTRHSPFRFNTPPSVVPAGKVLKLTPTTSTASLAVLARRVLADPHEVGRIEGIGPDLWKSGAALTRASVGREPVTAEDRTCSNPLPARPRPPAAGPRSRPDTSTSCRDYAAGHVDQGQRRPRHRPGYIPAYGVVDDPPLMVLTITRPRRPPLTPLGRGR